MPVPSVIVPPPPVDCPPAVLISCRDAAEVAMAVAAGVDIIDLKEPDRGPLAATDSAVWQEVTRRWPGVTFSVALGERDTAATLAADVPGEIAYAKAGPAGCDEINRLVDLWQTVGAALSPKTQLVAVAYADHEAARCLPVWLIAQTAISHGLKHLLIDTFNKNNGGIDGVIHPSELATTLRHCRRRGVWTAVAGSLNVARVKHLLTYHINPDCWAARGAVCRTTRTAKIDVALLSGWIAFLKDAYH